VGAASDHCRQLQLPVRLTGPGREHDIVVGAGDRTRQPEEHVGQVLGRAAVHQRGDLRPCLFHRARVVLRPVGHLEVDHMLPVVRPGLEHLARLDRRAGGQRRELLPAGGVLAGEEVEHGPCLVPVLQQRPGVPGTAVGQCPGQVQHPVAHQQAGEGGALWRGERAEDEGAEELRLGCHEVSS